MMRSFQVRIREALRETRVDDNVLDDLLRLWQDLTSFTALLLDVSKREELCIHDRRCLTQVLADTVEAPSTLPCSDEVMTMLRRCEGRDYELDALIAANSPVVAIRACTGRVLDELNRHHQRSIRSSSGTWNGVL